MSEHHVTTEARKVVTVLFSDIQGSTRLGELLDPESLRDMMSRYFAEVRRVDRASRRAWSRSSSATR